MIKKIIKIIKTLVFISIFLTSCFLLNRYFSNGASKEYSLAELKELLKETESLVVCPYKSEKPYQVCTGEDIVKTITDKDTINEVTAIFNELNTYPKVLLLIQ